MRGTPTIYFKSLNRPFNILGVDKSLFYLSIGFCLPIAFSARLVPIMDGIAVLIFLILYIIGTLVTRADPQMLVIYKRHVNYRRYYAAISGIHSKTPRIKPSVPIYQGKNGLV
jgi:type IV secretion system protein TrbD